MIRMIERAGGGLFECGSCDARFVFEHFADDDRIDEPAFCPVCGANRDIKEDSLRRNYRRWLRLVRKPTARKFTRLTEPGRRVIVTTGNAVSSVDWRSLSR
jgi:hypothetical protein